ncbi:MbtH family protein [Streptomyces coelicoflavus]|uniref:MbtH family protein n=1 Tax=Streptomyces coelicoflavus TaxID=285562 RepID=UPI00362B8D54
MANPFENDEASYFVLVNDEGQHSLWPAFAEIPEGWRQAHGEDTRAACLEYVERNWTDMRPLSLVRAMAGTAS